LRGQSVNRPSSHWNRFSCQAERLRTDLEEGQSLAEKVFRNEPETFRCYFATFRNEPEIHVIGDLFKKFSVMISQLSITT
jgi:hypothetical protein